MTVLALKASRRANAVSSLHGHVSRAMWMPLYPGLREDQVPIGHITNGVHVQHLAGAADAPGLRPPSRAPTGRRAAASRSSGEPIDDVDDGELWETHQALKARLIDVHAAAGRAAGRAARRAGRRRGAAAPRARAWTR